MYEYSKHCAIAHRFSYFSSIQNSPNSPKNWDGTTCCALNKRCLSSWSEKQQQLCSLMIQKLLMQWPFMRRLLMMMVMRIAMAKIRIVTYLLKSFGLNSDLSLAYDEGLSHSLWKIFYAKRRTFYVAWPCSILTFLFVCIYIVLFWRRKVWKPSVSRRLFSVLPTLVILYVIKVVEYEPVNDVNL